VIGVVLAVVVGLQTGAAAAVQAPIVDTGGLGANVRAAPTTASAVLTTVAEGASVTVECQAFGETIRGTDVWDFLPAYGGYVSDAFVLTGYDGRSPSLPECGSSAPPPGGQLRDRIVSVAWAEVGNGHDPKYGGDPSWEWCSVFATWVWRQAGVDIPNYPFTGDVFGWGQARGLAVWGSAGVRPGDVVLYGTGPSTPSTSTHIGVVVEVQGDGRLVTVEGNFNDAVSRVGPRWPSEDWGYGPVYGYVRPSP
jgi:hypothetical protein